jgi:aminoglycoside phosphotransferase (APT) family kinase protein
MTSTHTAPPAHDGPPTETDLARALSANLGVDVSDISDLHRLTGGSSRQIWAFGAHTSDGARRELVLRRDAPGEVRGDEMALEIDAMRAALRWGVPVPQVLTGASDISTLAGVVMERVDAETDPRQILDRADLADARHRLSAQCGHALGRLHSMPIDEIPGLPTIDRLAAYRAELDRLDRGRPVLELVYRSLVQSRPAPTPTVVVHGDFRLGNLAVDQRGLVTVFDWESVHVGDRLEDIGWIAVKTWRFRGQGIIGGFGEVRPFLDAYTAACGVEISDADFDWAVRLNTWIWAVGCLQQADRHLSGAQRSIDLAMVGRRVVEVERDLLELTP